MGALREDKEEGKILRAMGKFLRCIRHFLRIYALCAIALDKMVKIM
jgi:hypothetical protein